LPCWQVAGTAGQEGKAAFQAIQQRLGRVQLAACGGEFDGKWHAVEATTDIDHSRHALVIDHKVRLRCQRPFQEKTH